MKPHANHDTRRTTPSQLERRNAERQRDRQRHAYRDARALKRCAA